MRKNKDIGPCLNQMTRFLALIEQQCLDEILMPMDEGTWEKCIQLSEAPVKRNLDQIYPTNCEPKARKLIENTLG